MATVVTTDLLDGANGPGAPVDVDGWLPLPASDVVDGAWDALRGVYDPELYLDVVSLGLVYGVQPKMAPWWLR